MSTNQEGKRLTQTDLAAALVLLATMVGGILLVYFFRSTSGLAWPAYVGLFLIGVSLLLPFFPLFRQISPFTWAVGLLLIVLLTILTPTPASNQSYSFTLDTSKIKTDLSSLPTNGRVVVVLLVNNQEYSFNAQIYQTSIVNKGIGASTETPTATGTSAPIGTLSSTGTPIACQTGLPTIATITPVSTPAVPSPPAVVPCLNAVISSISVTLTDPTSAQLTNFTNLLPNASTIYLYPDATSAPGA